MSATDWTRALETELNELIGRPEALSPGDYWRLGVLLGRAAQHPTPPAAVEELAERAASAGLARAALSRAPWPTVGAVLDALDGALMDADEPAGRLADALLDVDDLVTVLELDGRVVEARAIAAQAVALIDLAPGGPAALDEWAARRLATVSEESAACELWNAVAAASAERLFAVLPARRPAPADVDALLERAGGRTAQVIQLWRAAPPVRRAWRAAAADYRVAWAPGEGGDWTAYDDDGVTVVQVLARGGMGVPRTAILVVAVEGKRWTKVLYPHRVGASSAWFRLGTEEELAGTFEAARTELGVGPDREPEVHIEWEQDGHR